MQPKAGGSDKAAAAAPAPTVAPDRTKWPEHQWCILDNPARAAQREPDLVQQGQFPKSLGLPPLNRAPAVGHGGLGMLVLLFDPGRDVVSLLTGPSRARWSKFGDAREAQVTAVMTAAGSSVGLDLHDCHYFRHDPADWAYDRGGQRILLLVVAIQPLVTYSGALGSVDWTRRRPQFCRTADDWHARIAALQFETRMDELFDAAVDVPDARIRHVRVAMPATMCKFDGTMVNPRADIFITPKPGGKPGELHAEFEGDVPVGSAFSVGTPAELQADFNELAIPLCQWMKSNSAREFAPSYEHFAKINDYIAQRQPPVAAARRKALLAMGVAEIRYSKRQMKAARAMAISLRGALSGDADDAEEDGESDAEDDDLDCGDGVPAAAPLNVAATYNPQQIRLLKVLGEVLAELQELEGAFTTLRKQLDALRAEVAWKWSELSGSAPGLARLHAVVPMAYKTLTRAINQQRILANEIMVFSLESSDHSES